MCDNCYSQKRGDPIEDVVFLLDSGKIIAKFKSGKFLKVCWAQLPELKNRTDLKEEHSNWLALIFQLFILWIITNLIRYK